MTEAMDDADRRFTVAGASVRALVRYGTRRGIAVDDLLAEQDLRPSQLDAVDLRVSQLAYNTIFERLAVRAKDDDFGLHFAEAGDMDGFHVVGHLCASAPTLGAALDRVARFSTIVHDAGNVDVERTSEGVVVHPGCRGMLHEPPRHVAEFSSASVILMASVLAMQPIAPLRVDFRHAAPPSVREHLRIFGQTPAFSRPETALVLPLSISDVPIPSAQSGLGTLLESYAEGLLERLADPAEDDLVRRASEAIARALEHGKPELVVVARQLGIGARTLQRRLDDVETSFLELVDSVRRTCAERYIADPRLSLQEVGFLLGYADASNFYRAFRRWFGTTPAEHRASLRR